MPSISNLAAEDQAYDVTDAIIRYEGGELDDDETVTLFQHLVNTGMAWTLQGHYGRTASRMLEAGLINPKET